MSRDISGRESARLWQQAGEQRGVDDAPTGDPHLGLDQGAGETWWTSGTWLTLGTGNPGDPAEPPLSLLSWLAGFTSWTSGTRFAGNPDTGDSLSTRITV